MHSTDFAGVSDLVLLQWLTLWDVRPNFLIRCGDVESEAITKRLTTFCVPPFHACALPGTLRLPSASGGTLFLEDVAALTSTQQIALNGWIGAGHGKVQIVSMTSASLWPLVEDGKFLEELFFRLNVVCLEAQSSEEGRSISWEDPDVSELDVSDRDWLSHHFTARRGPRSES
jgi:hypothetical protein